MKKADRKVSVDVIWYDYICAECNSPKRTPVAGYRTDGVPLCRPCLTRFLAALRR